MSFFPKIIGVALALSFAPGLVLAGAKEESVQLDFESTGKRDERLTSAFWDTHRKTVSLPLQYSMRDFSPGLPTLFQKQAVLTVASQRDEILAGGTQGTLALLQPTGVTRDFTGLLQGKSKRITGVGYLVEKNLWVIAGEAKGGKGPLLFTINSTTESVNDFQTAALEAGLERIDRLDCVGASSCLLIQKKIGKEVRVVFDGVTFGLAETMASAPLVLPGELFTKIPERARLVNTLLQTGTFTYGANPGLYVNLGGGIDLLNGIIPALKGAEVKTIAKTADSKLMLGGLFKGKPFLAELTLTGFASSAELTTKTLFTLSKDFYFKKATLTALSEIPGGTALTFLLSADDGAHWEEVRPAISREFNFPGSSLRLRAVLTTPEQLQTPELLKATIAFERAQVESAATRRKRDNQRLADLKNIARALENFKHARGVYPIVDNPKPEVRLRQLEQLLVEGKFLSKFPQDPKQTEEDTFKYDYLSNKSGSAYILRALLEEGGAKSLEKDTDGKPIEAALYEYTCDDPWYCEGKGYAIELSKTPPPPPAGSIELFKDDQGRIWRIAQVGGGSIPLQKRKLYLPSPALLGKLSRFYSQMKKVGQESLTQYPRVRFVKLADKEDIYYLTERWFKRRLLSAEISRSYGNDLREVAIIQPEELAVFPESRLIRLVGDKRVWYLEGGLRRYVTSPAILRTRGWKWQDIAPVNFAEYNSYPEGPPLR